MIQEIAFETHSRLVDPRYTGQNRCLPCTLINIIIAVTTSVSIGVWAPFVGGLTIFLFLLIIYFRGYLVPGTPKLTKKYFPERVLSLFNKGQPTDYTGSRDLPLEKVLREEGLLKVVSDNAELSIDTEFEDNWLSSINHVTSRDEYVSLGKLSNSNPENLSIENYPDDSIAVYASGTLIGQWESRWALKVDAAAVKLLEVHSDIWPALTAGERKRLLSGLRLFLETCPSCNQDLSLEKVSADSCCKEYDIAVVRCNSCAIDLVKAGI